MTNNNKIWPGCKFSIANTFYADCLFSPLSHRFIWFASHCHICRTSCGLFTYSELAFMPFFKWVLTQIHCRVHSKSAKHMVASSYPLLATTRLEHTVLCQESGGLVSSSGREKPSILLLDRTMSLCLQPCCTLTIPSAWNCYVPCTRKHWFSWCLIGFFIYVCWCLVVCLVNLISQYSLSTSEMRFFVYVTNGASLFFFYIFCIAYMIFWSYKSHGTFAFLSPLYRARPAK